MILLLLLTTVSVISDMRRYYAHIPHGEENNAHTKLYARTVGQMIIMWNKIK